MRSHTHVTPRRARRSRAETNKLPALLFVAPVAVVHCDNGLGRVCVCARALDDITYSPWRADCDGAVRQPARQALLLLPLASCMVLQFFRQTNKMRKAATTAAAAAAAPATAAGAQESESIALNIVGPNRA